MRLDGLLSLLVLIVDARHIVHEVANVVERGGSFFFKLFFRVLMQDKILRYALTLPRNVFSAVVPPEQGYERAPSSSLIPWRNHIGCVVVLSDTAVKLLLDRVRDCQGCRTRQPLTDRFSGQENKMLNLLRLELFLG